MDPQKTEKRAVLSWALYDWANSAFSTTVMAGFFPICYKQFWCNGVAISESTFHLGMANSLSSVIIAALSPFLGAIADRGGTKKKFLLFFAAMGIVMTGALRFVLLGQWPVALSLYMAACIGFAGGNIFYDSLIVGVAREEKVDLVSALGFALGYLGGGILFALNVWMTLSPQTFGLSDGGQALQISFLTVSIWWAVFSIPIFLFVDEPEVEDRKKGLAAVRAGIGQLAETFRKIRNLRVVFLFLIAYWLYIDGVDTIVRMAVDYGMSIGFEPTGLITALLITQFVGFPAALVFGKIGQRLGAKTGILIGIGVYLGVTIWGYFIKHQAEFYILAVVIGLVQGGVQALSRSFYTRIIPRDKVAEFFGFYNLLGKFAAVIGPFMMGWVSMATGDPRYSILSIGLLFLAGGIILFFVDEEEGRRAAADI
jgi:UMF1 family MFS transporter